MPVILLIFLITPNFANAYIGPALGLGAIALTVLFVLALLIILFSIIYYPIKFIKKKLKKNNIDEK